MKGIMLFKVTEKHNVNYWNVLFYLGYHAKLYTYFAYNNKKIIFFDKVFFTR